MLALSLFRFASHGVLGHGASYPFSWLFRAIGSLAFLHSLHRFGCLLCASQETFREVSDPSVSRCFDVHAPFSLLTSCPRHALRLPRDRKVCRDMVDLKELATKKMQEERKKQRKEKKASKVCQRRRQKQC